MKTPAACLLAAAGLALATPADAASFNCRYAKLPSEVAICNSARLSGLDEEMAQLYFRLTNQAPGRAVRQIKNEQTNWLARRNSCGYDTSCLIHSYNRRIDRLYDWQSQFGL